MLWIVIFGIGLTVATLLSSPDPHPERDESHAATRYRGQP